MVKRVFQVALAFVLVALLSSPAAAQRTAGRRGPVRVEAAAGDGPVVSIDPDDPFSAVFDLHLLIENVAKDQAVTLTDIRGELTFRDGSTSPVDLLVDDPGADYELTPGSGLVSFAYLLVPMDAPTGGAVSRIVVEYQVGGVTRTAEVVVHFAVVQHE